MPQYANATQVQADRLENRGGEESLIAAGYMERADRYTLCVVLYALTLFFAGLSTRLRSRRAQTALVATAWGVLLGAAIWVATFPVSISV
jgi:hypothetical protein